MGGDSLARQPPVGRQDLGTLIKLEITGNNGNLEARIGSQIAVAVEHIEALINKDRGGT